MKLVTDIKTLKRLTKEKEEENWGFRSFLKSGDIPSQKIDLIAHKIYDKIITQIDCKTCANCCKALDTFLIEKDIVELAGHLKMSPADFETQYVAKTEDGKQKLKKNPCFFLKGNLCSVFDARPTECRSFPNIQDKSLLPRLISLIHNCAVCPVVYNLYEELKKEIWMINDGFEEPEDEEDL
jgi:uncharacterized protein